MCKRMTILFLLSVIGTTNAFSRQLTPEERQRIILQLDSTDSGKDIAALSDIVKNNIVEAVPFIEEKIWKRWNGNWDVYLDALLYFKAPKFKTILYAMIDSSDVFGTRPFIDTDGFPMPSMWNPTYIRVRATYYLFKLGDYSTVKYVFEGLRQREETSAFDYGFILLKDVAKNVPQYADSVKTILVNIIRNSTFDGKRSRAKDDLVELFGKDAFPELVHLVKNDNDGGIRMMSLDYLFTLKYPALRTLLLDRLFNESFELYKQDIAESLLVKFGSVEDYTIVKNFVASTPERTIQLLLGDVLKEFKPPVPPLSTPVLVMLDSLISYKHQVAALGWLGDEHFVKELDNDLENAQKHLAKGDSVNTSKEVEKFQEKVNKEYERTIDNEKKNKPRDKRFVTEEGYKFLSYNAKYIIDRLPKKK